MNNYYFTLLYFTFTLLEAGFFTLLFTLLYIPYRGYSKVKIEKPGKVIFYFIITLLEYDILIGGKE